VEEKEKWKGCFVLRNKKVKNGKSMNWKLLQREKLVLIERNFLLQWKIVFGTKETPFNNLPWQMWYYECFFLMKGFVHPCFFFGDESRSVFVVCVC
jgi:hypothetical protein